MNFQNLDAVLFDRDGVLNIDHGFVFTADRFDWMPGALELLKCLAENGIKTAVVTNQSGIGRGLSSEPEFLEFTGWIHSQACEYGGKIDRTFYCPHHPVEAMGDYKLDCECRKPRPGLVLKALEELQLDAARTILLGDHERDLKAAQSAGVAPYLFTGSNLFDFFQAVMRLRESEPQRTT